MLIIFIICSRISLTLNSPFSNFSIIFSCRPGFNSCISFADSINPCISPIPSIFEMNGRGEKVSRSWRCSPVPMKMMGHEVAATLWAYQTSQKVYEGDVMVDVRGNGSSSFRMSIQFRHNNRSKVRRLLESSRLSLSSLSYHSRLAERRFERAKRHELTHRSVEDHNRTIRFDDSTNLHHLLEELSLL